MFCSRKIFDVSQLFHGDIRMSSKTEIMFQFFLKRVDVSFWIKKWLTQGTMQYFAFMILVNQYHLPRAFIMNEPALSEGNLTHLLN